MALSTRGRGAHSAPSGVTTSFRPPRFVNVSGMWTVIVSPSAEIVARVTLLPSCCPPPHTPARRARSAATGPRRRAAARRPVRPAAARSAPARPGKLVPQRIELRERLPRLDLGEVVLLGPGRTPRADDDLGLPEDAAQLVDQRRLDICRRHPSGRTRLRSALQHILADVVEVEPVALACVRRRHRRPGRSEDQPRSGAGVGAVETTPLLLAEAEIVRGATAARLPPHAGHPEVLLHSIFTIAGFWLL